MLSKISEIISIPVNKDDKWQGQFKVVLCHFKVTIVKSGTGCDCGGERVNIIGQDIMALRIKIEYFLKIKNIWPKKAFSKEQKNKSRSLKSIKNKQD